ncbi:FAD-dependent oxidoreductase, partial [Acinetobacter baumannii]
MDIAIIGSGMAGLAAARILKDAGHTITIFEALPGRGMDSHSIEFDGGIIDAPLRVMN